MKPSKARIFSFVTILSLLLSALGTPAQSAMAATSSAPLTQDDPCLEPANEIVAENCLAGNPSSEWEVSGAGDANIQGFATDISVNGGGTIEFKVDTDASDYRLDIYRLGYYNGNGARLITTIQPSAVLPQAQPACLFDATDSINLLDCGNWSVSARLPGDLFEPDRAGQTGRVGVQ